MQEDFGSAGDHFYLQYFFPPSSVGETGRVGGMPGRREVGHGMLAQRALVPTLPSQVRTAATTWLLFICYVEGFVFPADVSTSVAFL